MNFAQIQNLYPRWVLWTLEGFLFKISFNFKRNSIENFNSIFIENLFNFYIYQKFLLILIGFL